MIRKLLFTVVVIGILYLVISNQARVPVQSQHAPQPIEARATLVSVFTDEDNQEFLVDTPAPAPAPVSTVDRITGTQMQSVIDNVKRTRELYMTCRAQEALNVLNSVPTGCPLEKQAFDNAMVVLEVAKEKLSE